MTSGCFTNLVNSIAWSCSGIPIEFFIQAVTASRATEESTWVPEEDENVLLSINCALDGVYSRNDKLDDTLIVKFGNILMNCINLFDCIMSWYQMYYSGEESNS